MNIAVHGSHRQYTVADTLGQHFYLLFKKLDSYISTVLLTPPVFRCFFSNWISTTQGSLRKYVFPAWYCYCTHTQFFSTKRSFRILFVPRICKEYNGISNGSLLVYCWTEEFSQSRSYTNVLFYISIYHIFHCISTTFHGPFHNYVYYVKYPDDVNNKLFFLLIHSIYKT